jgi:hypothetical protein
MRWGDCNTCYDEVLHIRHHSLFAPRDFDISPYFEVVKPTLRGGFDFRALVRETAAADAAAVIKAAAAASSAATTSSASRRRNKRQV